MGMSIDEIEQWEKKNKTVKVPEEKWLLAQEIMRKYQKIEELVEYHMIRFLPKERMSGFQKDILDVLDEVEENKDENIMD